MGRLDEKMAKNGHLYVQFSQKLLFKVKKSFTKRSAWSENFSRLAKICSPRQLFSLSLLGQNAAWTNLLPVTKKKPRENQYSSSSRKKKRQRPNTIQILWIVKKPRAPQYSYAQLTASQL